jgi:uncharacterized phosphosugar-binding protein
MEMSAGEYMVKAGQLLEKIHTTQLDNIQKAAQACAASIAANRAVHFFGSGHSVIPVLYLFPRYGGLWDCIRSWIRV